MSTFSKQTAAAALVGNEVVPVSQLSSTVTKTATTLSALASDNSYNDSGAGFVTAGFAVGDYVNVSGFTGNAANNIYSAKITALTTSKMTIGGTDGDVIVDDAAGESVTISKWLSRRTTAQDIADLATGGGGGGSPITYTIDTGSTADSDPGAGLLKFNNASQASATMIYIDNATADAVTMTTLFASLAQTGFVTLVQSDDPTFWRIYKITAVTSASGYYKLTVVNQAGSASDFADAVSVLLAFDSDASTSAFTGGTLTSALNEAPAVTLASASTVNIGAAAANTINVTGTTTITAFDSIADGALRRLIFGGILTLTYNATSLILPTAASITTAAGDSAVFLSLGSGNWRCVGYTRADGTSLSAGSGGYINIPQNSQSAAYTTVAADAGKHIFHPAADANARTFTIDSNANVPYALGTTLTFINETSQLVTIAITSDTLTLAGTTTTGSRTLSQNGMATAVKITSTKWLISGSGLS